MNSKNDKYKKTYQSQNDESQSQREHLECCKKKINHHMHGNPKDSILIRNNGDQEVVVEQHNAMCWNIKLSAANLISSKIIFQNEGEIKAPKDKLKECVASRHALSEILKEVL